MRHIALPERLGQAVEILARRTRGGIFDSTCRTSLSRRSSQPSGNIGLETRGILDEKHRYKNLPLNKFNRYLRL